MPEWQQLFVLAAALWATVLSWDGYLFSITKRPLNQRSRFIIDILLVFIYMFLLMTSKLLIWWVFLHALIYVLYAIWDCLSVRHWLKTYYIPPGDQAGQSALNVYIGGLKGDPNISPGPIITIMWGAYFWALYLLNDRALHWLNAPGLNDRIVGTTIFVLCGLHFYRRDKTPPYFTMGRRLRLIVSLLIASAVYVTWLPTDRKIWSAVGPYIGSAFCDPENRQALVESRCCVASPPGGSQPSQNTSP
jgi:hypothetical protein